MSEEKKEKINDIQPGTLVRVHQKIKELDAKGNLKERIQVFEGIVIARKGGNKAGATFTVRKIGADKIGVEKIFPIHSPTIVKIETVKKFKTRRAKLYYLRKYKKKLKEIKK
jgi:large subunit ribosomal protein L19